MTHDKTPPSASHGGFVDLHTHVLPAVDDGAVSLEACVEMLRLAHGAGTRRLVATPHLFLSTFAELRPARLRAAFETLQSDLARLAEADETSFLEDLRLHLAAEHHLAPELFEALQEGDLLPFGSGRRLLVELPVYMASDAVESALTRLFEAGYQPLLAHVERYPLLLAQRRHLRRLLDMGCLLQINGDSVLSSHKPLQRQCVELLRRGWVHAIASDAHDPRRRTPDLAPVARWLEGRFGAAATRGWLRDGPAAILDGEPISVPRRAWRDWFSEV